MGTETMSSVEKSTRIEQIKKFCSDYKYRIVAFASVFLLAVGYSTITPYEKVVTAHGIPPEDCKGMLEGYGEEPWLKYYPGLGVGVRTNHEEGAYSVGDECTTLINQDGYLVSWPLPLAKVDIVTSHTSMMDGFNLGQRLGFSLSSTALTVEVPGEYGGTARTTFSSHLDTGPGGRSSSRPGVGRLKIGVNEITFKDIER